MSRGFTTVHFLKTTFHMRWIHRQLEEIVIFCNGPKYMLTVNKISLFMSRISAITPQKMKRAVRINKAYPHLPLKSAGSVETHTHTHVLANITPVKTDCVHLIWSGPVNCKRFTISKFWPILHPLHNVCQSKNLKDIQFISPMAVTRSIF